MKNRLFLLIVALFKFISYSWAISNEYIVEYSKNISSDGVQGVFASVKYQGHDDYYKNPTSLMLKLLNFTVLYENEHEFTLTITDAKKSRFSIPKEYPYSYTKNYNTGSPKYQIYLEQNSPNPFSSKVKSINKGNNFRHFRL